MEKDSSPLMIENNVSADSSIEENAPPATSIWNRSCSGNGLREALFASARWLEQHTEAINALNVFPVPDGDTGTNMTRTIEAAVKEVEKSSTTTDTASHIGKRLSYGALMGARGNSGVILSQIIRGLADGLTDRTDFTARDLANSLTKAKEMAYRAVIKPVEGTMLTVIREAAEAAEIAAGRHNNFYYVLIKTVEAARQSVLRTPSLLPALREAGVVDAGGHGCFVLLEGALKHVKGEELVKHGLSEVEQAKPQFTAGSDAELDEMDAFGYCTNFMLFTREPIVFEEVRDKINAMGQSAVIVGDSSMVKVHIHTENPGAVLSYVTSLGSLDQIKLDNMQSQHEVAFRSGNTTPAPEEAITVPPNGVAIIAVVAGKGLASTFKVLGTSYIVSGGQTMNPSTEDLLNAVNKVPANEVIILPNNKNIILVAQQIAGLTEKQVHVVPTITVPQGITALSRLNYDASAADNVAAMKESMSDVLTGEVTRAVRSVTFSGIEVKEGQWIGLINDNLTLAAESREDAIWQLLEGMHAESKELITLYFGEEVSPTEADIMQQQVQERYTGQVVELVSGGQPLYPFIISVE